MSALITIFNSVSEFLSVGVWLAVLILLLVSHRKFTQPDKPLSLKAKLFFLTVAVIVVGYNLYTVGYAYYLAYHPDYGYDKISQAVDFHVYRPGFIPGGRVQETKFYLWDQTLVGQSNVVRVAYNLPAEKSLSNPKTAVLILTQTRVGTGFDWEKYLQSLKTNTDESTPSITPVTLSNWPKQPAYVREEPMGNRNFIELAVLSPDGVLILIDSLGETSENLVKMAESLK